MKKGIIAILAVAIIGVLGIHHKNENPTLTLGQSTASSSTPAANSTTASSSTAPAAYKDGTFTGQAQDTAYGTVQIAVVINGGKIVTVNLLQMPSDQGHSQEVTRVAGPMLKQTTIQKQSANIDFVSGATSTSEGYQMSLQSALDQAV